MPNYGTRIISLERVNSATDEDQILIHIKSGDKYLARRMTLEDFAESMNLIVNAFLPLDGSLEMSGDIIDSDNTHSIGSLSKPWLNGYFNNIYVDGNLIESFVNQITGNGSLTEIASTSAIVNFVNSQTLILSANINDTILPSINILSNDIQTLSSDLDLLTNDVSSLSTQVLSNDSDILDIYNQLNSMVFEASAISFDNTDLTGYLSSSTDVQSALQIVDQNLSRTVSSKSNEFFTAVYENIDLTSTGNYTIYTVPENSAISISKLILIYVLSLDYDDATPATFALGTDTLSAELYEEEIMVSSLFAEETSEYEFSTRKIYENEEIIFTVPVATTAAQHQISVIIQGSIISE